MRVLVVEPPEPIVTFEEAVARLRLSGDEDERLDVEAMIAAATRTLDGPDGWLGRALGPQTLEARLDNFDCGSVRLPYPPHISVASVKYLDMNGEEQAMVGFELIGGALMPVYGGNWPAIQWRREAVRVRYRAGYETADGDEAVPEPITAAILLMVGDLYRNRDTTRDARLMAVPMSTTVESLLSTFRAWL